MKQAFNDKEDWLYGIITEDFNEAGDQVKARVSYCSLLVNILGLVVNEQVVVADMLSFSVAWEDHVASDCHHQGNDALPHDFLEVLSLDKCCKEFNQILSHAFYPWWILIVAFEAFLSLTLFRLFIPSSSDILEGGLIADDFSIYGDVLIKQLPCRL